MIARCWTGETSAERSGDYVRHLRTKVLPVLAAIEGHRGAYVLERGQGDRREILVMTLWESMEAVKKFAGEDPDQAVVPEEVRAMLSRFDEDVKHFEVLLAPQFMNR